MERIYRSDSNEEISIQLAHCALMSFKFLSLMLCSISIEAHNGCSHEKLVL